MPRDRDAMVWTVLGALGIEDADLLPLGAGFASEAWRIGQGSPWYALRIAREWPDADSTYEMEHALMSQLIAAGAVVPTPLRGSWQLADWTGPPFSLTVGLEGAPLSVGDRTRAVPALAGFLRTLHGLAVPGYGPLHLRDGVLAGESADLETGLRAWARRPLWPLGDARLDDHPALADRADLRGRLDAHAGRVRDALLGAPAMPLHSDLHEENILDLHGSLGCIDFGEALVGPAAWEFAAMGYFMDWATADAVLGAYLPTGVAPERMRADASAIGLCFGVYRWAQDRDMELDQDEFDEGYLEASLARL